MALGIIKHRILFVKFEPKGSLKLHYNKYIYHIPASLTKSPEIQNLLQRLSCYVYYRQYISTMEFIKHIASKAGSYFSTMSRRSIYRALTNKLDECYHRVALLFLNIKYQVKSSYSKLKYKAILSRLLIGYTLTNTLGRFRYKTKMMFLSMQRQVLNLCLAYQKCKYACARVLNKAYNLFYRLFS